MVDRISNRKFFGFIIFVTTSIIVFGCSLIDTRPTTKEDDLRRIFGLDTKKTQRSALIYDDLCNNGTGETGTDIYLVTTQDEVTLGEFRSAIQQTYTTAEDGIFLDGGGSTQIKAVNEERDFSGDGRTIPQIVALESVENPPV